MWFGTEYGLCKYDGYKFTHYIYNPADSNTIGGCNVSDIHEDHNGNLWIAAENSVSKLALSNRQIGKFTRYHVSQATDIETIITPSDTLLLVAGLDIVRAYDKASRSFISLTEINNHFSDTTIKLTGILLADHQNNLWIGSGQSGLYCIRGDLSSPDTVLHFPDVAAYNNRRSYHAISALLEDSQKNIWIASYSGGLVKIPPNSYQQKDFIHFNTKAAGKNHIKCDFFSRSIVENQNGHILFSSDRAGIARYNPTTGNFTYSCDSSEANKIASNRILSLYLDRENVLWTGTKDIGVIKLREPQPHFGHYPVKIKRTDTSGNDNINVWSITKSRKRNHFWVGLDHGLCLIKIQGTSFSKIFEFCLNPESDYNLNTLQIRDIYEYNDDALLIASLGLGLIQLNLKTGANQIITQKKSDGGILPSGNMYCIEEANLLWLGVNDGNLTSFNKKNGRFTEYPFKRGRQDKHFITTIKKSDYYPETLWIGEWNQGLISFNTEKKKFTFYRDSVYVINANQNHVTVIYEENKETIWLGTYGGGLIKCAIMPNPAKSSKNLNLSFQSFTSANGLGNDMIYGILKDDTGKLWLSTNTGLSRFDPQTEKFTNYTAGDGLPFEGFNMGAYLYDDHRMFFGGGDGLYYFSPPRHTQLMTPNIVLTGFNKFGKPVKDIPLDCAKEIELDYTDDFFSFEFAALSYMDPGKNQYAYKMNGFDKDWIYIKNKREAVYTNLDPGKYVFKVKTANGEGLWNDPALSIAVRINAPFWLRWPFYLVLFLSVTGLILIINWSLFQKTTKIRKKLQADLARNFHDDTSGHIAGIRAICYNLREPNFNKNAEMLSQLTEQTDKLSNSIKDLLFEIDPGKSSLTSLIIYLKDYSESIFENSTIAFQISGIQPDYDKIALPPKWRANLIRIFKEGMNNIVKHSRDCENARLSIVAGDSILVVKLSDDGCGFDKTKSLSGNGLKNMIRRAADLNSTLEVSSRIDYGTELKFSGKLPKRLVDTMLKN